MECGNWSHYANIFGPSHYLRCRPQYYHWHQVFLTTSAQNHGYHINSMNIKYFERKYYKNWPKYYPCLYWECLFKCLSQKQPVRIFLIVICWPSRIFLQVTTGDMLTIPFAGWSHPSSKLAKIGQLANCLLLRWTLEIPFCGLSTLMFRFHSRMWTVAKCENLLLYVSHAFHNLS